MDKGRTIGRRLFLAGAAGLASAAPKSEHVLRFGAGAYEVQMTVEFYDRYRSRILGFEERQTSRHFCLSAQGEQNRGCVTDFAGAIAIVRYHVRQRSGKPQTHSLRERVRVIDQDDRLGPRAPVDRRIELQHGVGSDIQAFGFESAAPAAAPDGNDVWCLLRQDLFLDDIAPSFLVVHWKHTPEAIRILDIVPGRGATEEKSK